MYDLITGKFFTYCILGLYICRCVTYAVGTDYPRALYWLCALGITISAEFLIAR